MQLVKRIYIFLPIVLVLEYFLWNLPPELIYHRSQLVRGVTMFGGVFFLIPACIYLSVSKLRSKNWVMIALISIPINGIGFASTAQKREISELKKNGINTTGVIIEKSSAPRRHVNDWQVKILFQIENQMIISEWRPDYEDNLILGDSIEITYLPDFPKINRLMIELE